MTREYSLFGDLDGMTVRDLREMLDKYSDETVLDARTRTVRGYGRYGYYGPSEEEEYFVFIAD